MENAKYVSPSDERLLKSLKNTVGEQVVNKALGRDNLIPKRVNVTRDGKTYQTTVYVNPNDDNMSAHEFFDSIEEDAHVEHPVWGKTQLHGVTKDGLVIVSHSKAKGKQNVPVAALLLKDNEAESMKPVEKPKTKYEKLGTSVAIASNARPYRSNGKDALKAFLSSTKSTDKVDSYSDLPGGSWMATVSGGSLCESLGADYIEFGGGGQVTGSGQSRKYETTVYKCQPYKAVAAESEKKEQLKSDLKPKAIKSGVFVEVDEKIGKVYSVSREGRVMVDFGNVGGNMGYELKELKYSYGKADVEKFFKENDGKIVKNKVTGEEYKVKYGGTDDFGVGLTPTKPGSKGITSYAWIHNLEVIEDKLVPATATEGSSQDLRQFMSSGNKEAAMKEAKKLGITWQEHDHAGVNWMRASMAIKKHLAGGGSTASPKEVSLEQILGNPDSRSLLERIEELVGESEAELVRIRGNLISEMKAKYGYSYKSDNSAKAPTASKTPKPEKSTASPKPSGDLGKYESMMDGTWKGRADVMGQAIKDGLIWAEHANPNVNWMRAVMTIKKHNEQKGEVNTQNPSGKAMSNKEFVKANKHKKVYIKSQDTWGVVVGLDKITEQVTLKVGRGMVNIDVNNLDAAKKHNEEV